MICTFSGPYGRFLSNFYPCTITFDGDTYPSVEHAYQASKTFSRAERGPIRRAKLASTAKRLGKEVTLRPDWEQVRIGIMEAFLRQKFADPRLARLLAGTEDHELIEGNEWGDTFWGVCKGVGENHLGKLLMKIREEIRPRASRESVP